MLLLPLVISHFAIPKNNTVNKVTRIIQQQSHYYLKVMIRYIKTNCIGM